MLITMYNSYEASKEKTSEVVSVMSCRRNWGKREGDRACVGASKCVIDALNINYLLYTDPRGLCTNTKEIQLEDNLKRFVGDSI